MSNKNDGSVNPPGIGRPKDSKKIEIYNKN